MSRRKLRIGDVVTVNPDAIENVRKATHGGFIVEAHAPYHIVDEDDSYSRSVYRLVATSADDDADAWAFPGELRLASGRTERASAAAEKRVAEMVAAKAEREKARRIPKRRRDK